MTNILTVDDDRHILTSLSVILKAAGFEVEAFPDGAGALDAFSRIKPDLALIDITMPRMDGLELLQKLRQKSWIPIIFLTSKIDEIDEILGLRMGADEYVTKPFSERLLIERIRTLLRRNDLVSGKIETDKSDINVMKRSNLQWIHSGTPCNGKAFMWRLRSPSFIAASLGNPSGFCEKPRPIDGRSLWGSSLC